VAHRGIADPVPQVQRARVRQGEAGEGCAPRAGAWEAISPEVSVPLGGAEEQGQLADVDGDGKLDLLTSGRACRSGTATATERSGPVRRAGRLLVRDRGSRPRRQPLDLVVASSDTNGGERVRGSVSVLYGNGDGSFAAPWIIAPSTSPARRRSAISTATKGWIARARQSVRLHTLATSDRSFSQFSPLGVSMAQAALTDLNGDGSADIVAARVLAVFADGQR
jgi:hypothetical protein